MIRTRKFSIALSVLTLASSIALLGCAEEAEPSAICDKDECLVPSCEFVCAQVYGGCDLEFQISKRRAASEDECVMACDKGFFSGAELGCMVEVFCDQVSTCFEDEVPSLPADLLISSDDRPEASPPDTFAPPTPGDDGAEYQPGSTGDNSGNSFIVAGDDRPEASLPDGFAPPTPGDDGADYQPGSIGGDSGNSFIVAGDDRHEATLPDSFAPPTPGDDGADYQPGTSDGDSGVSFLRPADDGREEGPAPGQFYPRDGDDDGNGDPDEFYPGTSDDGRSLLRPVNDYRDDQVPGQFYPPTSDQDDGDDDLDEYY